MVTPIIDHDCSDTSVSSLISRIVKPALGLSRGCRASQALQPNLGHRVQATAIEIG